MHRRILALAVLGACLTVAACTRTAPDKRSPLPLPTQGSGSALGLLSYNVPCYMAQGGASIVVGSGCTLDATSGTILGATANDLNGAALVLDPGGSSSIQATADYSPILALGGTPTAASFSVKNSLGTPVAVIRGNGELSALNALVAALLYAAGGTAQTDAVYLAGERVKIIIAAGGNAKSGTFYITVG